MMEWLSRYWPYVFSVVSLCASIGATLHAVLTKRDTRAVIGWVGLIWLSPIVGAVAYSCLGVNRIKRQALSLRIGEAWTHAKQLQVMPEADSHAQQLVEEHPNLRELARLGTSLTGKPLLPGNTAEMLKAGDEAYPAMLKAIDEAQISVALLSYIFDHDRSGLAFLDALVRAQERGVEVRVLIDYMGSRYSKPNMVDVLGKAGLKVASFLPTKAAPMLKYANLRNHRKILVVDGRIGFTGGTNIREGHELLIEPSFPVDCLHFRFEGPVVQHLQEAFAVDWMFATDEALQGDRWFPATIDAGRVWARGIPDGPDEDFEVLLNTILGALASAKERIWVVTPYFLPDTSLVHALNVACMKGIDVKIVVPATNNLPLVQWASTALFPQLIEKGCEIYLGGPPFDHSKVMVVDGVWSLVGSTNWDPRSLRLNFEYNVECYDKVLAVQIEDAVREKVGKRRPLTMEDVSGLPLWARLRNGGARLLTPYL